MKYSASNLRERLEVLELTATEGGWDWTPVRKTWAGVEVTDKSNLFSKVGVGARDAALVLRKQGLSLHNALRWKGEHLFLTSIVEGKPGWLDVRAARVEVEPVRLPADGDTEERFFPGVLTEKYVRYTQEWPMSANELCLVLVVPKAVALRPACLVETRGAVWEVLVPHELDPYKNEYEIGARREL